MECTYCGSDLADYDPVFVEETVVSDDGGRERVPAGAFCNYGCLNAHIDEAGLAEGAACSWSSDG